MKTKNILFGILAILTAGAIGTSGYIIGRVSCVRERDISFITPAPEVIPTPATTLEPEEPTSTEPEEIIPSSEIDTSDLSSEVPIGTTEDWKTYRNEEYGFEFKYPKVFEPVDTYKGIYKPTNSKRIIEISYRICCKISFDNGMYLSILYSDDQSKYPDLPSGKYVYRNFEGTKNQRIDSSTGRVTGDTLTLYLKTNDGFYTFRWEAEDLENRGFNYRNYLIPILSTFKFTYSK